MNWVRKNLNLNTFLCITIAWNPEQLFDWYWIFACYRMLKHTKISSGAGGSPVSNSRLFSKRFNHPVGGLKVPTDKENSSSRRSYSMDYSLGSDDECSPSKVSIWAENVYFRTISLKVSRLDGFFNSTSACQEHKKIT